MEDNYSDVLVFYMSNKKTYRLLSQMYQVTRDCLSYYVYFKAMQGIKAKEHNNWYIATSSAYYDLCVLHWCMLFGSERTEPTHFCNLVNKNYGLSDNIERLLQIQPIKVNLKNHILHNAGINHTDFYKFRNGTLRYRNKNLIHREHGPDSMSNNSLHRPVTKIIMKSAFSPYEFLIQLATSFPDSPNGKNKHKLDYCLFKSKQDLFAYYKQAFPKEVGDV